jgi:hypothetical protein
VLQHIAALTAGCDDGFDTSLMKGFQIELAQSVESLLVSRPDEVMSTTPLI